MVRFNHQANWLKMFKRTKRKWGHYITLFRCKWLCIKILCFKKDGQLSLQRHKHRSEVWIWRIKPNQVHTFKPANDCKIFEIQYGPDVREGDIERL